MLAIIKTGGKQYKVAPKQKIKIEKLNIAEGNEVVFDEVLLVEKNKSVQIGAPFVEGAKVVGKLVGEGKGKKVTVLKYKAKKRYSIKRGHRQPFTEVEITKIEA